MLVNLTLGLAIYFSFSFISVSEAASLTEIVGKQFPTNCHVEKQTVFFEEPQDDTKYIVRYNVQCPNKKPTTAYLENHIVRTMRQVLLMTFQEDKLSRLKTLVFNEPGEYEAPKAWLKKFLNLSNNKFDHIDGLSGATLTSNAVKRGTAKIFSIHRYLKEQKK